MKEKKVAIFMVSRTFILWPRWSPLVASASVEVVAYMQQIQTARTQSASSARRGQSFVFDKKKSNFCNV